MNEKTNIKDVPKDCLPAPGYIIVVCDGSAWLTIDGWITEKWPERGIWPTVNDAQKVMMKAFPNAVA